MTIRPILLTGSMVRATLADMKTQTRRVLGKHFDVFRVDGKPAPVEAVHVEGERAPRIAIGGILTENTIRFAVGDLLWVRESLYYDWTKNRWLYKADDAGLAAARGDSLERPTPDRWPLGSCPSLHMPRWASRLTLKVTGVKVERLQDITEAAAIAEGINRNPAGQWIDYPEGTSAAGWLSPIDSFRTLWDSINGKEPGRAWADNPWIVAVTFDVIKRNVLEVAANAD